MTSLGLVAVVRGRVEQTMIRGSAGPRALATWCGFGSTRSGLTGCGWRTSPTSLPGPGRSPSRSQLRLLGADPGLAVLDRDEHPAHARPGRAGDLSPRPGRCHRPGRGAGPPQRPRLPERRCRADRHAFHRGNRSLGRYDRQQQRPRSRRDNQRPQQNRTDHAMRSWRTLNRPRSRLWSGSTGSTTAG